MPLAFAADATATVAAAILIVVRALGGKSIASCVSSAQLRGAVVFTIGR